MELKLDEIVDLEEVEEMNESDDFDDEAKAMDESQEFIFTPEFIEYNRKLCILFDDKEGAELLKKIGNQIADYDTGVIINVLSYVIIKIVCDNYDISETKTLKLKKR